MSGHRSNADHLFADLAMSIVTGEVRPGDALPRERALTEQSGLSRNVVRRVLHRLEDLGLVEVRQGSGTYAQDPKAAGLRVLFALRPFASDHPLFESFLPDLLEHLTLYPQAMLDCAGRRATDGERAALWELVKDAEPTLMTLKAGHELSKSFWEEVARIGRNRVYQMEIAWWNRVGPGDAQEMTLIIDTKTAVENIQALARALREREDPVPVFRRLVAPMLRRIEDVRAAVERRAAASPRPPHPTPEPPSAA